MVAELTTTSCRPALMRPVIVVSADLAIAMERQGVTASQMLNLFPRLDKEVATSWNLDCNPLPGIAGPNVKSRIPRSAVDGPTTAVREDHTCP